MVISEIINAPGGALNMEAGKWKDMPSRRLASYI